MAQKKKIPVVIGEELIITPNGMGKADPYFLHKGFVIFIKNAPVKEELSKMRIRITAIKETFGFAECVELL